MPQSSVRGNGSRHIYGGTPTDDRMAVERGRAPGGGESGRKRTRGLVGFLLVLALVADAVLITMSAPVRGSVTVEAGTPVTVEAFMKKDAGDAAFADGVSAVDTSVPGKYKVKIVRGGKTYTASLTVEDTVPPTGVGRTVVALYGAELSAAECVEDVRDATAVTAQWHKAPDMEKLDEPQAVVARLTDAGGNSTDVSVQVTVKYDAEAPVIQGAKDIEAFVGDSVTYRDGVTVTDDQDPAPSLAIDSGGVNVNAAGTYTVTYTATDASGNSASQAITVTLKDKPAGYVDEQTVYQVAQEYYDAIIDDDMTDMEKAFAIYRWVKYYVNYEDHSDHDYWTVGAYQAFTRMSGDCYIFFSAAKTLLNMAGIENYDIVKSDTSRSSHYWLLINLGYGWYHYDACPRAGDTPDNTFMLTDQEMDQYSRDHDGSNVFDPTLYPERSTESVQAWVNYDSGTITQPEPHADGA